MLVAPTKSVSCSLDPQEQKLRPGEKIDMPVFFYVDPEFATDPRMKRVNHLTLSYTFFKVTVGLLV
jgi:cytochrome c oxidase assembly protein Cox11